MGHMGYPRSRTIDPAASAVYHCISRCARRAFLLADPARADWIVRRLGLLASAFAVDVLEYAVLSNHLHLVLRVRPELAWCWTDEEVVRRWSLLHATGGAEASPEKRLSTAPDEATVDLWRGRLADLGWFHKELKEPCARLWNREDGMEGCSYWQGRYAAKAALDDAALICQALYVLLNPVRAGVERAVGESELTSMGRRMRAIVAELRAGGHADVRAAFESRVDWGPWTPVFPCDPGSAAALADSEYARRVARGRHRASIRRATRREGETLLQLAAHAPAEELVPLARGEGHAPRHRLRPRAGGSPTVDVRESEACWLTATENPFAPDRFGQRGAEPIVSGMTLGAVLRLADEEGRRARPDKRGRIATEEPPALEAYRKMATAASPDLGDGRQMVPRCVGWLSELDAGARVAAEVATEAMARDRERLGALVAAHGGVRVCWFGTASGGRASLGAEASRRSAVRVVGVRPTAA